MDKIKEFFQKIGYADIFDKIEKEDSDVEEIATSFKGEFEDVLSADLKKRFGKDKEDDIYKKVKNSLFQKLKTGLKLSDVGNVKEYDDESEFIKAINAEVSEREKSGDKEFKTKFESLTEKYNSSVSDLESTTGKLTKKEKEFDTFQSTLENKIKAKSLLQDELSGIKWGVNPAIVKDYHHQWWNEIDTKLKVDPETGSITDKDGGFIVEDNRKIGTLKEWISNKVKSRGLESQNNGRPAGGFVEGTKTDDPELQTWVKEAKEAGMSEDTIDRYMKNRKPVKKTE